MTKKLRKKQNTSKIKCIIRENKTTQYKLNKIFTTLSLSEIRSSTRDLLLSPDFEPYVTLYKNNDISKIYDYTLQFTSLDKSIYWAMGVFVNNIDKIKKFIKWESEITDNILSNNLKPILSILDDLDRICGISIWSISLRINILTDLGDRSETYKFLDGLIRNYNKLGLFSVIIRNTIKRNNSNDSMQENRSRLDRQIRNICPKETDELYYILKYKTLSFNPIDDYNFEHILNIEKNSTLIDLFTCCTDFVVYGELKNIHLDLVRDFSLFLSKHLPGSIFDRISDSFKKKDNWDINIQDVDLLDKYSMGDYSYCYEKILKMKYDVKFFHIEIAAKSACRISSASNKNEKDKLIILLKSYLIKENNYHSSKNELFRMQNKFRELSLYKELLLFIEASEVNSNENIRNDLNRILYLISTVNSPFRSDYIYKESKQSFLTKIRNNYKETYYTWMLYNRELGYDSLLLKNISPDRVLAYYGKSIIYLEDHSIGKNILNKLISSNDLLISYEASNNLLQFYNDTGNYFNAVELYNGFILKNRNYVYLLNNNLAANSAQEILNRDIDIKAIITYSLISRYVDSSMNSKLRAMFNGLMKKYNCIDPLEINSNNDWSKDEFIYFLRYICTPKIIKFFKLLKTPSDIDKCRISICNYLISIEKDKDSIENELKEITKKIVLQEATLQVAHSKIDSDLSALKSGENVSHLSGFKEYMSIIQRDYGGFLNSMKIVKVLGLLSDNDYGVTYFNGSNPDFEETNNLFKKLVRIVIDEFCFGEKGLNANVSTRIRHGHLPNTIRKSLLKENLITSISEDSKIIRENTFWLNVLSDNNNYYDVNLILNKFTTIIDNLIHKINEEILQVSTLDENLTELSKTENPLFLYTPSDIEILLLQEHITLNTTYVDFINIVENWLWDLTQNNLSEIRQYITKNITQGIVDKFRVSMSEVVKDKNKIYVFNNAINSAMVEFRNDISTIISWFRKKEGNYKSTFDLEIAAKIASQALLIDIDLVCENNIKISGDKLSCYVDILYILYENSISKSLLSRDLLDIKNHASLQHGCLSIYIENSCAPFDSVDLKNEEIKDYIDSYGVESIMMDRLHSEGGTGFAKIWKIITKDLGNNHKLKFGFKENNIFYVHIEINVEEKII